ncbi:Pycsar system effector family protein [Streptomyces marianii]|uniref:Pycsar system effector family protein n=1 Tax=Streptomyces marianii TaxID=1817406 RepID=UPI002D79782D|nr:Pycsar system effector family protein [Streptomyces marianii]
MLAFNGAVIAGLFGAADKQLPLPCRAAGGIAIVALAASAVLLLLVVRPRLAGADRASFPYWARHDAQRIRAEMCEDRRPDRIRVLSQIALRKFVGLRRAIDLSLAAIAFVVFAALAAL